ncbi:hypothetical protein CTI12_AA083870 [Artemisia annua]|uniref:Helitron helicase-like domain-containing protein n=1 Tax=Artemisia annua TaxID=35608 RepID=A0A2U1Q212_ARTAN|nr:hypothetical protein CTI12_AA083870 [Artemisia annua]
MPRKPRYLSHNTNNRPPHNKTSSNLHSPWFPFVHPSEIDKQQPNVSLASTSVSKPPNDSMPLKVPLNSQSRCSIDNYFPQSKNLPQKRKKTHAQEAHSYSNEGASCHKGYEHVDIAPHARPPHRDSLGCDNEVHDSQQNVSRHVASQNLSSSNESPSSSSNVSLEGRVPQNKRQKRTQTNSFQSGRQTPRNLPQKRKQTHVEETHADKNGSAASHRGGRNVATNPQPSQGHLTASNNEMHDGEQHVDDRVALQNVHSAANPPPSSDNGLSQNKRQKRPQSNNSRSTRRPTGGATHDVRQRLRTENLTRALISSTTPDMGGPSVLPTPDPSPSYQDLGDCDQRCRYCGAAFWYEERVTRSSTTARAEYHLCCGDGKFFKLKLYNAEGVRGYELPTSNTLAAIVFDSGPTTESDYDVIIQYKGGQPQRINKLHKSYMSMQFPVIFIYGQPGFHTGLIQMEDNAFAQQQTTADEKTLPLIAAMQEPTTGTSTELAQAASDAKPLQPHWNHLRKNSQSPAIFQGRDQNEHRSLYGALHHCK